MSTNDPSDICAIKLALSQIPDKDNKPYWDSKKISSKTSEKFFEALKQFQLDHDCKPDGLSKPDGETIKALTAALTGDYKYMRGMLGTSEIFTLGDARSAKSGILLRSQIPLDDIDIKFFEKQLPLITKLFGLPVAIRTEDITLDKVGRAIITPSFPNVKWLDYSSMTFTEAMPIAAVKKLNKYFTRNTGSPETNKMTVNATVKLAKVSLSSRNTRYPYVVSLPADIDQRGFALLQVKKLETLLKKARAIKTDISLTQNSMNRIRKEAQKLLEEIKAKKDELGAQFYKDTINVFQEIVKATFDMDKQLDIFKKYLKKHLVDGVKKGKGKLFIIKATIKLIQVHSVEEFIGEIEEVLKWVLTFPEAAIFTWDAASLASKFNADFSELKAKKEVLNKDLGPLARKIESQINATIIRGAILDRDKLL